VTVLRIIRFAFSNPSVMANGLLFSGSLLAILVAQESGHYVFCRYYGVDATLPFFIPQPPLLIPGTFGAFIRMKSPVPSRRALFDIGLAGPLAGFVVIVPVAFVAVLTLHHSPLLAGEASTGGGVITFNDPLLFRLIARWFKVDLDNSVANSFYLAAWVGALVTSLNLIPVGQLDGGHGVFAVFGKTAHWWIARAVFVAMVALSLLGWLWHGSPAWFVFVVLLAVMLRVGHPQPQQMEPLGTARIIIGIRDADCFCAVLSAVSDYDHLINHRGPEKMLNKVAVRIIPLLCSGYQFRTSARRRPDADPIEAIKSALRQYQPECRSLPAREEEPVGLLC
jgi:membrane-associated protease RseP (regulator of RpoE activity)